MINKKIFGITENIALIHFFLMFGYKLFSFYFPLFLLEKSFSIIQVGYTSFLIYISIAIFAPVAGYLNHKIKPYILIALGVLGYSIYSLAMLVFVPLPWFYFFQVLLGISGALFFVSSRSVLMSCGLKKPDSAFAWFYSAPSYADAIAPAVGALIIWKFGFFGVFASALIIQLMSSLFAFFSLKNKTNNQVDSITLTESVINYKKVGKNIKTKGLFFIFLCFLILLIAGFNNIFFVLFLKNLNWTQNQILVFNSLISLSFLPISFFVAKKLDRFKSEQNICFGGQVVGIFSILLGIIAGILNSFWVFIITLCGNIGSLISNSGRSGLMATKLKEYPKESAAIDTIFSPLATAFSSLFGGFLIVSFGYSSIFIFGGALILMFSLIGLKVSHKTRNLLN